MKTIIFLVFVILMLPTSETKANDFKEYKKEWADIGKLISKDIPKLKNSTNPEDFKKIVGNLGIKPEEISNIKIEKISSGKLGEFHELLEIPLEKINGDLFKKTMNDLNVLLGKAESEFEGLKNIDDDLKSFKKLKATFTNLEETKKMKFGKLVLPLKESWNNLPQEVKILTNNKIKYFDDLQTQIDKIKVENNNIVIPAREMLKILNNLDKKITKTEKHKGTLSPSVSAFQDLILDNNNTALSTGTSTEDIKTKLKKQLEKILAEYKICVNAQIMKISNLFFTRTWKDRRIF